MLSRSLLLKLSMQSVKHFSTRLLYMRRLQAQGALSKYVAQDRVRHHNLIA